MEIIERTPPGGELLSMSELKTTTDHSQELEALKQHNFEASSDAGEIHIAGVMSDIAPKAAWRGKVSVEERLKSGELTREDIENGFEFVNGFYVPATKDAPMRCGDEREDQGYDDSDPDDYTSPLGPQLLGGDIAVAHALWLYEFIKNPNYTGNILNMFGKANSAVQDLGFSTGVHGDDAKGKAGCGAAATQPGQLIIISSGTQGFRDLVAGYMGDGFEGNCLQLISEIVNRKVLASRVHVPGAEELVEEALKFNNQGYAVKVGPHPGVGVVKNSVKGTTLHVNHLNSATKGKLPFFNVDAWFDKELAEAVSSNSDDQTIIEHLRAMQTIATSMMLKDGSLFFGTRLPKS